MIYAHYSQAPFNRDHWPNFTPAEFACKCCGQFFLSPPYYDAIQRARDILGKPIRINSAHRCAAHNARVGGAPMSQHKRIAIDVSLKGSDRYKVLSALKQAGFTSFGLYRTFIHCDMRIKPNGKGRFWYGAGARKHWSKLRGNV